MTLILIFSDQGQTLPPSTVAWRQRAAVTCRVPSSSSHSMTATAWRHVNTVIAASGFVVNRATVIMQNATDRMWYVLLASFPLLALHMEELGHPVRHCQSAFCNSEELVA